MNTHRDDFYKNYRLSIIIDKHENSNNLSMYNPEAEKIQKVNEIYLEIHGCNAYGFYQKNGRLQRKENTFIKYTEKNLLKIVNYLSQTHYENTINCTFILNLDGTDALNN